MLHCNNCGKEIEREIYDRYSGECKPCSEIEHVFIDEEDESEEVKKQIKKDKEHVLNLFNNEQYREVIVFVDRMFGWEDGELHRPCYTKEIAMSCIKIAFQMEVK